MDALKFYLFLHEFAFLCSFWKAHYKRHFLLDRDNLEGISFCLLSVLAKYKMQAAKKIIKKTA